MPDEILYLMVLYKGDKISGFEVNRDLGLLTERYTSIYKGKYDSVKFFKCEEINDKESKVL